MPKLSKAKTRKKSDATIVTCGRRNDVLYAAYLWLHAKVLRKGVRSAEKRLLQAAAAYYEARK